jgi:hypothetical protein
MRLPAIDRRRFLRGAGAVLPLPFLPSLIHRAFAAEAAKPPKRMVFLGFGFGTHAETWEPDVTQTGKKYTLSPGLKPLERHKAEFTVVQGLPSPANTDPHMGTVGWLTAANRFGVPGKTFHNSISADQVAAGHLGPDSRFASIQLTSTALGDGHGPGLSLAWDAQGKPIGGFATPVAAYHKLFSEGSLPLERRAALLAEERSVLDVLLEDTRSVHPRLNKTDADKLDEYLQGIRDIESRLSKEKRWLGVPKPKVDMDEPAAGLVGKEEIRLMYDIIVAAFQTDSTRVVTYRQPLQTLYNSIGINRDCHQVTHYFAGPKDGPDATAAQQRDLAQSELLAHLLDRLAAVKEADGSRLLDHVALVYGSTCRAGHMVNNCPTLLAGGAAGIRLGEQVVVPKGTPLANCWLTLLKGCGVPVEKHADSTGVIDALIA